MTDLVRYAQEDDQGNVIYDMTARPLKSGGRRDVIVHTPRREDALTRTDIVANMRRFFAAIDEEAKRYEEDPVTTVQALAKVDALLADLRMVRNTLHKNVAQALSKGKVRRLTVEGVITVEGTSDTERKNWDHARLLTDMLKAAGLGTVIVPETGEALHAPDLANIVLAWMRPEWRLTPIRDVGLEPDAYCDVEFDDFGHVVRTPGLKVVDNAER